MNNSEKNLLLDKLSVCYHRANYLKTLCEEQNQPEQAAQFERRKSQLKKKIDGLQQTLYEDWIGSVAKLKEKLDKGNTDVQKAIKSIEKSIKTAENIAKAIGYLDDAIQIATDLVP